MAVPLYWLIHKTSSTPLTGLKLAADKLQQIYLFSWWVVLQPSYRLNRTIDITQWVIFTEFLSRPSYNRREVVDPWPSGFGSRLTAVTLRVQTLTRMCWWGPKKVKNRFNLQQLSLGCVQLSTQPKSWIHWVKICTLRKCVILHVLDNC